MSNDIQAVEGNPFLPAPQKNNIPVISSEQARAIEEVRASMVIAKQFPRDQNAAYARIITACKRISLAEVAQYSYPRGGQTITGPSIRLAEAIAQNWGNISFGIQELEKDTENHESTVRAFAWDMETNTKSFKEFKVAHVREKRTGKEMLESDRDIYEMSANQGARRLRACILAVIPGDIVEAAETQCEQTLKSANQKPLSDRIREMLRVFQQYGVQKEHIEAKFMKNIDAMNENDMLVMRKYYTSLKDGMATPEQIFPITRPQEKPLVDVSDILNQKNISDPLARLAVGLAIENNGGGPGADALSSVAPTTSGKEESQPPTKTPAPPPPATELDKETERLFGNEKPPAKTPDEKEALIIKIQELAGAQGLDSGQLSVLLKKHHGHITNVYNPALTVEQLKTFYEKLKK